MTAQNNRAEVSDESPWVRAYTDWLESAGAKSGVRISVAFQRGFEAGRASARPAAPEGEWVTEELAKQFHDGPLGADDHAFDPSSPQGKWCVEVAEFFLAALSQSQPAPQPSTDYDSDVTPEAVQIMREKAAPYLDDAGVDEPEVEEAFLKLCEELGIAATPAAWLEARKLLAPAPQPTKVYVTVDYLGCIYECEDEGRIIERAKTSLEEAVAAAQPDAKASEVEGPEVVGYLDETMTSGGAPYRKLSSTQPIANEPWEPLIRLSDHNAIVYLLRNERDNLSDNADEANARAEQAESTLTAALQQEPKQ